MTTSKLDVLPSGTKTDNEWESYIRSANVGQSIIEHGKRWYEFFLDCQKNYGKSGGSHYSEFAIKRFTISQSQASQWKKIGEQSNELITISNKFAPDWRAMYDYLRLDEKQKKKLLSGPDLISQKTIKAIKGTRGDHSANAPIITDIDFEIRAGDFREVLDDIPDGTVDLILTDPPYPVEFLPLWSDLAEFASRKLRDNGLLMAYTGKYALPEVLNRCSEHLNYWWTSAIFLDGPGHSTPLGNPVRKVISQWRPVVMFVRNRFDHSFPDVVPAGGKEKGNHNWEQSTAESIWMVDRYSPPGGFVVDPMAGSGTVAKACRETGRQFIGADINA